MKQKSFFILVNIWTCYCWFLIINVSLVSFCFFGNLLEDHFDKSISTILGPIGQLIWLSSEIVQTDTKPHHTLDFLRFWGILTRHLQIQGGGGCVDKKVQMQKLTNKTSGVCKECGRFLFFLFFSRQRGRWLPSEPEDLTWQTNKYVFLSISKER